jgi:hypothetical protein
VDGGETGLGGGRRGEEPDLGVGAGDRRGTAWRASSGGGGAWLMAQREVSYLIFMPKPSTHRMHDPGSNVPYIRLIVLIDNQMS